MNRRSLIAAAYLGMLIFGIVLTTLGAVLPSIIERFGIDTAVAGTLFLLMSFGIMAGSLVFGPLVDRPTPRLHGWLGSLFKTGRRPPVVQVHWHGLRVDRSGWTDSGLGKDLHRRAIHPHR